MGYCSADTGVSRPREQLQPVSGAQRFLEPCAQILCSVRGACQRQHTVARSPSRRPRDRHSLRIGQAGATRRKSGGSDQGANRWENRPIHAFRRDSVPKKASKTLSACALTAGAYPVPIRSLSAPDRMDSGWTPDGLRMNPRLEGRFIGCAGSLVVGGGLAVGCGLCVGIPKADKTCIWNDVRCIRLGRDQTGRRAVANDVGRTASLIRWATGHAKAGARVHGGYSPTCQAAGDGWVAARAAASKTRCAERGTIRARGSRPHRASLSKRFLSRLGGCLENWLTFTQPCQRMQAGERVFSLASARGLRG